MASEKLGGELNGLNEGMSVAACGSQWVFPVRLAMPAVGQEQTTVNDRYGVVKLAYLLHGCRSGTDFR